MNQANQGSNSAGPENQPAKRKRGRPRKDERPAQEAKASSTPKPDTVKRNRQRTNPAPDIGNAMVGQVVSGVLDGKFEAGYLLTVKVGDTNTLLRGVVFEPGKYVPVSGANDVAPHVAMLRRDDIAIPAVVSQVPMHGSTPQSEQKQRTQVLQRNEDSVPPKVSEPVTQVSEIATQVLPSPLQSKPLTPSVVQNDTRNTTQAAAAQAVQQQAEIKAMSSDIMPRSQATESVVEKKKPTDVIQVDNSGHNSDLPPKLDVSNNNQAPTVTPQLGAERVLKKEPTSATQTFLSEHNKTVEPEVVLLDNEAPSVSVLRNARDTSKDSSLEPETEPSVELLSKSIDDQVSRGGSEAVGSESNLDMHVDDASKSQELKLSLTTVTDGSDELKHDMQIDDASKSLEPVPEFNLTTATDGSELKADMQVDDASKILEPKVNLITAIDGTEIKPDLQADDVSKNLEPRLNLTTTDGSELKTVMQIDDASESMEPKLDLITATYESVLKPDMQIDDASNSLEPEINLNSATDGSELNPGMQIHDASKCLEPKLNLNTAADGSELKSDMQIDDTSKGLETELNLTSSTGGSELEPDQRIVDELKYKATGIDHTLVATTPEAIASQQPITISQGNGTLQNSERLQDTDSKVPLEIARTDEVTKSEPQLEPRIHQQVGVLQSEEATSGARNGSKEEDLVKPNVVSKDAPESKAFDVNVPIEGEDAVFSDAAVVQNSEQSV